MEAAGGLADPLLLGADCCLHVARALCDVKDVLALSACSRGWRSLCSDDALWRHLCCSLPPPFAAAAAARAAAGLPWLTAYQRAHQAQSLRQLSWQRVEAAPGPQRRHWPREREGHAACAWGRRGMLVSAGFSGGVMSDLHLLLPEASQTHCGGDAAAAGSPAAAEAAAAGAAAAAAAGGGPGFRWVQPQVAGRPPIARYGHSLTRCGRRGELAVLFGGMMAGGYQAPLDTIAVLRRKRPAASGEAAAAAAVPASGSGGSEEEEEDGGEEQTSLGLRLGQGQQHEVLWAQLMLDFWGGGELWDEEEGEEEEAEEEEDDEADEDMDADEPSDPFHAAAAAAAAAEAASDSGGEQGEAEGEELWRLLSLRTSRSGSAASDAVAPPASAVAAMSRSSSSRSSGSNSRGAPTAAAAAAAAAPAPAAEAAAPPAWVQRQRQQQQHRRLEEAEEELSGEEQWEWVYPRTGGEAPGARGYHSAAASEDGTKIYFFGGISANGACSSLSVLDVTTWQFSCPATSGTPPSPRCGHSACVYGGRLWVVGGGSGRDLLRSGRDLADVHCLDLRTMVWRKVPLPPGPLCAGKCHAAALVGRRLLLFGGSMAACNELAWLDLEQLRWGAPVRVAGPPPCDRMSATAVLSGDDEVLVFGGYTFQYREVGDLWRLRLLPPSAAS